MTETTQSQGSTTYDVVVLGAGPIGQNVTDRARAAGLTVAVVERELVGGECSYWACVPSKALLRPVIAVSDTRRVDGARQAVSGTIDTGRVFARRNRYVTDWDDSGQAEGVKSMGADLFRGHGRIDGPAASRSPATTAHTSPSPPGTRSPSPPAAGLPCPTSPALRNPGPGRTGRARTPAPCPPGSPSSGAAGSVSRWPPSGRAGLPGHPAGPPSSHPRMEPFAGELVAGSLTDAGVDVRTGVELTALRRPDPRGPVTLTLDDGGELEGDEVMLATGRAPNTDDIGLDTVGLTPGAWLDVDTTCLVRGADGGWLYALGDVNHRALLTHQGKYQGRTAGDAMGARAAGRPLDDAPWGDHATTADQHAVPQVFFTDPEAAAVGLTAQQAADAGHRVKAVDVDFNAAQGANLHADGYQGHARMVVDLDRDVLLGVTFVGPGVSELLHSATVAVAAEVPLKRLRHAIACFPAVSEIWLFLLAAHHRERA